MQLLKLPLSRRFNFKKMMQIYFRTVITRLLFRYLVVVVVGCCCPGRGLPVDVGQVAGVLQGLSDLL